MCDCDIYEDEDADWQTFGGETPPDHCRSTPRRRSTRSRRRPRPSGPDNYQWGLRSPSGPFSGGGNPDQYNFERDYRLRYLASLSRHHLTEAIERFQASLLFIAQQRGRNMSYERWQQVQSDQTLAESIFGQVFNDTIDSIRDKLLEYPLGESLMGRIGTSWSWVTALLTVFDISQWRNSGSYRVNQVYSWLIGVVASNIAAGSGRPERNVYDQLVRERMQYTRWRETEAPRLNAWAARNRPPGVGGPAWRSAP